MGIGGVDDSGRRERIGGIRKQSRVILRKKQDNGENGDDESLLPGNPCISCNPKKSKVPRHPSP